MFMCSGAEEVIQLTLSRLTAQPLVRECSCICVISIVACMLVHIVFVYLLLNQQRIRNAVTAKHLQVQYDCQQSITICNKSKRII
jgi:hypothetical protein